MPGTSSLRISHVLSASWHMIYMCENEMYKYVLSGTVYPPRVNFSTIPLSIRIEHADFGIRGDAELKIRDSAIELKFVSYTEVTDIPTLKNFLEEAIRMAVDAFCYVNSYSYDVDIEKIECEQLQLSHTFEVRGEYNIDRTVEEYNQEYLKLLSLFMQPNLTYFKDVFADFRRSIKYPAMTASFCFRAIEIVRKYMFENPSIVDENKKRKAGWLNLCNQLGYQKSDFEHIQSFATPNRHGKYPTITYRERERIMNFTRGLLDKCIERELSRVSGA